MERALKLFTNLVQVILLIYAVAFIVVDGDIPLVRVVMTIVIVLVLDWRYKWVR